MSQKDKKLTQEEERLKREIERIEKQKLPKCKCGCKEYYVNQDGVCYCMKCDTVVGEVMDIETLRLSKAQLLGIRQGRKIKEKEILK